MALRFEWNLDKAKANQRKHGVSFAEAATAFSDTLSVTYHDPDHSRVEERFITFGITQRGRLVVVAHTDRSDSVRIISARQATTRERHFYEEEH